VIRALLVGGLALLAGCAEFMPRPAGPAQSVQAAAWEARVARLNPRNTFALTGRIAVQHAGQGGQARMQWDQAGETFALRLSAPLGQGAYAMIGNEAEVTLKAPDGHSYSARDLDSLMATHLQWSLPVAGARYWVRGLPVPDHPMTQLNLDAEGRMLDLAQDGWRISVLEYQDDLPRKLFLLGDKLQLRIVITAWTRPPE
jgi:outer membrane lipoprotein LolB